MTEKEKEKEKENNRTISKVCVRVDHAIGGIKRFRCLKVLRNTKDGFTDLAMVIACSLHNLRVDHRKIPLILGPKSFFPIMSIQSLGRHA